MRFRDSSLVRQSASKLFSITMLSGSTLVYIVALLVLASLSMPLKAQQEAPPKGLPAKDPNQSQNVIPTPPVVDEPPPEQEDDVAKTIKLDRDKDIYRAITDKDEVNGPLTNPDEKLSYTEIFDHAQKFSEADLAKYSIKNVTHADLIEESRKDFLRELIHLEGRLVRVRPMKAPEGITTKVSQVYEGWFFNKNNPEYPVCVVFAELPEGIVVGDTLSYRIKVDGYYFKLRKYASKEKMPAKEPGQKERPVERLAPLILAKTIVLDETDTSHWGMGGYFIPVAFGVFFFFVAVVFGLFWWFRREDQQVQLRNQQTLAKKNPFEEQAPSVEPGAAWNRVNQPPSTN